MPADAMRHRVLFVITALGVGGAETQLLRLATALRSEGWPVSVVALRDMPGLGEEFVAAGVPVTKLGDAYARLGPLLLPRLTREVRRFSPDCVVTLLFQANVLGRLVGTWCRVPVISSIRNTRFGGSGRTGQVIADVLERWTIPMSAGVVVNSRLAGEELVVRGVARAATLRVIPNALAPAVVYVDRAERVRERAELGFGEDAFVFLTVGSLQPQKNHGELLRAFAALRRERPEARLLIVGEGPLFEPLVALVQDLGLSGAVTFLGLRRDVPRLLRLADGFVLASTHEGLPNVVMEALAAGLATAGTPVGGVPELITDGVTGWLAESPAAIHLHTVMRRLIDTAAAERRAIADTGRQNVEAGYGLPPVLAAWRAVIDDAVSGRGERS